MIKIASNSPFDKALSHINADSESVRIQQQQDVAEFIRLPWAFQQKALKFAARGYCPLPIGPNSKAPGWAAGELTAESIANPDYHQQKHIERLSREPVVGEPYSRGLKGWQDWSLDRILYGDLADVFKRALTEGRQNRLQIGILMGGEHGLVGLDIDNSDPRTFEAFDRAVGDADGAVVRKTGRIGFTQFFRSVGDLPNIKLPLASGGVDILAHQKQSVVPPSNHAETGRPYRWLQAATLEDTGPELLPVLTRDMVIEFARLLQEEGLISEKALAKGWTPEGIFRGDGAGGGSDRVGGRGGDYQIDVMTEYFLARADEWIGEVGLTRLTGRDGRWAAVPTWRKSGQNRPTERRKRSLDISRAGIIDRTTGQALTAAKMVGLARGISEAEGFRWLADRFDLDNVLPMIGTSWGRESDHEVADGDGVDQQALDTLDGGAFAGDANPGPASEAVTVAEAGALVDAFTQRFKDKGIPAAKAKEAKIEALKVHLAKRLDQQIEAFSDADSALEAIYEGVDLVSLPFDAHNDLFIATLRIAGKYGQSVWKAEGVERRIARLASQYDLWLADPYCGTGKTRSIKQILLSSTDLHVALASPTNALSWAIEEDKTCHNTKAMTGWAGMDRDGKPLCARHEQGSKLQRQGIDWETMCGVIDEKATTEADRCKNACPHYEGCPARHMMEGVAKAQHLAMTHNHLQRPFHERLKQAFDAIVIDESISGLAAVSHVPLKSTVYEVDMNSRAKLVDEEGNPKGFTVPLDYAEPDRILDNRGRPLTKAQHAKNEAAERRTERKLAKAESDCQKINEKAKGEAKKFKRAKTAGETLQELQAAIKGAAVAKSVVPLSSKVLASVPLGDLKEAREAVLAEIKHRKGEHRDGLINDAAIAELKPYPESTEDMRLLVALLDMAIVSHKMPESLLGRALVDSNGIAHIAAPVPLDGSVMGARAVLHASAFPEPDTILQPIMTYQRTIMLPRIAWARPNAEKEEHRKTRVIQSGKTFDVVPRIIRMDAMKVAQGANVQIKRYRKIQTGNGALGLKRVDMAKVYDWHQFDQVVAAKTWTTDTIDNRRREMRYRFALAKLIKDIVGGAGQTVVVATEAFRLWFAGWFDHHRGRPEGLELLSWGHSAGSNRFQNFDQIVTVGVKRLPSDAMHWRKGALSGVGELMPAEVQADEFSKWCWFNEQGQAVERTRTRHPKGKPTTAHVLSDQDLPGDCVVEEVQAGLFGEEYVLNSGTIMSQGVDSGTPGTIIVPEFSAQHAGIAGIKKQFKLGQDNASKKAALGCPAGHEPWIAKLLGKAGEISKAKEQAFYVQAGANDDQALQAIEAVTVATDGQRVQYAKRKGP